MKFPKGPNLNCHNCFAMSSIIFGSMKKSEYYMKSIRGGQLVNVFFLPSRLISNYCRLPNTTSPPKLFPTIATMPPVLYNGCDGDIVKKTNTPSQILSFRYHIIQEVFFRINKWENNLCGLFDDLQRCWCTLPSCLNRRYFQHGLYLERWSGGEINKEFKIKFELH